MVVAGFCWSKLTVLTTELQASVPVILPLIETSDIIVHIIQCSPQTMHCCSCC